MFGNVGRKLVEGTVGLFAVLGFVYVPLGRHTGFEHARAVLATPAATAALEDVTRAALHVRERVIAAVAGQAVEPEPRGREPSRPQAPARVHPGPKPVPPKLD